MSHSDRTRIRTKRCPNCGLVQDSENYTCDECRYPEHDAEGPQPKLNENNHSQGEPS